MVTLPLTTSSNGHNYRLRNIYLSIYGSSANNISFSTVVMDSSSNSSVSTSLPTGSFSAQLSSYSLELQDGNGIFQPVRSQLVQSYQTFAIYNGVTTTLTFSFQTDGIVITTGMGTLTTKVMVTETGPACDALGTTCPAGRWCPPFELTSMAPMCVNAGSVQLGKPCAGPIDCVANASCFDLGSGPTCIALCPSSQFNAACATGGTCVAQGKTYGICQPSSGGGGDGGATPDGGDGGGLALSPVCQACSFGPADSPLCVNSPDSCFNCDPTNSNCDTLQDPGDRKLCQDLYTCFVTSNCMTTGGDPIPCWCGTNPLTCVTDSTGPGKANGPCIDQILAASKLTTYDAAMINGHFIDSKLPLGMAVNEAVCQGSFCASECGLP